MQRVKRNKIVNFSVKLLLFSFFVFLLYRQIFIKSEPKLLAEQFSRSIRTGQYYIFILTLPLAFINWSFEAMKWKLLMSPFQSFTFRQSIKTILAGIGAGIVTPLQIGEYLGRIISVKPEQNWKSFWATFIGSIAQNITTFLFGLFGMFFLLKINYNIDKYILYPSFYIGLAGVILLIFVYFNISYGLKVASRLGLSKFVKKITNNDQRQHPEHKCLLLSKVLMLSFLRYFVFATQFYLLLLFFGMENNVLSIFSGISGIFLLQTGIPLPPAVNFIARGEIAVVVFEQLTTNKIMILSSTFSLWVINLVLPAFIGMIFLIKMNIIKSLGYDA